MGLIMSAESASNHSHASYSLGRHAVTIDRRRDVVISNCQKPAVCSAILGFTPRGSHNSGFSTQPLQSFEVQHHV